MKVESTEVNRLTLTLDVFKYGIHHIKGIVNIRLTLTLDVFK